MIDELLHMVLSRGPVTLFVPPKESHQRKGIPGSPVKITENRGQICCFSKLDHTDAAMARLEIDFLTEYDDASLLAELRRVAKDTVGVSGLS
jgi:hypothetical protein